MDFKKCIVESGKKLENSGLTIETWGNTSIRDPETGLVYSTPSATKYSTIVEDDAVVRRLDGTIVEGHRKLTIETGLHLVIHRNREEVNAVIHTHPMYSMVYAMQGKDIPLTIDEAAQVMGGICKCTQYALPDSEGLVDQREKALGKEANSCLPHPHGVVCASENTDTAFKVVTILEVIVRILYMIEATGGKSAGISPENVAVMKDFVRSHYGQGK